MKEVRERQSNLELLRCVLMFMVVVLHFIGHNALSYDNNFHLADKNWCIANLMESFCVCAVDCYVLISGYFTINFSLRKIIRLLFPIAFYELCLSLVFYKYYKDLSFSPFNYWFVRPYFLLMLVSPILNEGLKHIGRTKLLYCCGIMALLSYWNSSPLADNAGKTFVIFIMLYSIGYYLGHYNNINKSRRFWKYLFFSSSILIFLQTLILEVLNCYQGSRSVSYNYNSFFIIIAAVSLLMFFVNLNIGKSRFINWVASSAFFVYIISENRFIYAHPHGMYDVLQVQSWQSTYWYPFFILMASICVFVMCVCIDKVCVLLFEILERYLLNKCDDIENKILSTINRNENKL